MVIRLDYDLKTDKYNQKSAQIGHFAFEFTNCLIPLFMTFFSQDLGHIYKYMETPMVHINNDHLELKIKNIQTV